MNSEFDPRDYKQFSDPGEYKRVAGANGYRIPLQFFISVSNIMKKRNITFGAACDLLEEKEYIKWVGKMAIYNIWSFAHIRSNDNGIGYRHRCFPILSAQTAIFIP
jgi:hypothetical protein